ncbi:uncharacterized protein EDB93DRAFT_1337334 [Suillus bovinus]|uniref:uncharacterized protein n=1 Tax=Suillus bovinus TaxID=48563 RepID=UPI001B85B8B6|nr:uncharacterized protein EDB93DRAFT_1337334 [Suillus bovinus]KAG2147790.1 hypothetical protein EDB93DRAFT_1337334 [Suillus bovinus]
MGLTLTCRTRKVHYLVTRDTTRAARTSSTCERFRLPGNHEYGNLMAAWWLCDIRWQRFDIKIFLRSLQIITRMDISDPPLRRSTQKIRQVIHLAIIISSHADDTSTSIGIKKLRRRASHRCTSHPEIFIVEVETMLRKGWVEKFERAVESTFFILGVAQLLPEDAQLIPNRLQTHKTMVLYSPSRVRRSVEQFDPLARLSLSLWRGRSGGSKTTVRHARVVTDFAQILHRIKFLCQLSEIEFNSIELE